MSRPDVKRYSWRQRAGKWLREQAKAEIVLPVIIAAGLLAYVSSVAAAPRSGGELWLVVQHTWFLILVLTIPYLAARALVWHELLLRVCIRIPWRQLLVAFAGGELTKSLPAGVYTQNYLLGRLEHFNRHSFVRSSMATTAMLGLETAIALPIAMIIGIPGAPWLFWTLLAIVLAWIAVIIVAWMLVRVGIARTDPEKHALRRRAAIVAMEFLEAAGDLVTWRTLRSLIPTAIYMLIYVIDLYAILRALGVDNISFIHTMAVYAVIVLAVVLIPIPTELGITELTGLGALTAYGVPGSVAAVAMLSMRLLATGMTILVAALLLFVMRGEFARARAEERQDVRGSEASASG